MPEENTITRRKTMKLAGAAAATAVVAGCSDDDGDDGENGDGAAGVEISPDERILFDGHTSDGFIGVEPSSIEGESNPTLVLEEGEEYEIGWREGDAGDGMAHNVVIWDENGDPVNDYYTGDGPQDTTDDPGDGDFLTFEPSEETVTYRCHPHAGMEGDIELQ